MTKKNLELKPKLKKSMVKDAANKSFIIVALVLLIAYGSNQNWELDLIGAGVGMLLVFFLSVGEVYFLKVTKLAILVDDEVRA